MVSLLSFGNTSWAISGEKHLNLLKLVPKLVLTHLSDCSPRLCDYAAAASEDAEGVRSTA